MAAPLQPEFFLLLGIDLFLAISLLSCLLDKHLPWQLPYLYQVGSLAGFGQLIVAKEFMAMFGDYTRFWFSILYLTIALANIIAINVYLGIIKKMLNYAKTFMLTVSFPSFAIAAFFLTSYSAGMEHPIAIFPQVSGSGAAITGAAVYTLYNPTAGTGVFMASAIALAIACVIVLGVSLYIFVRIWKETLKEKKRKRR